MAVMERTDRSITNPADAFRGRRQAFRTLHERGCFVIPNPWDVGSARYLQHLGFQALATTSAGFAFSRGLPDSEGAVSLDQSLVHIAEIAAAVDLPLAAWTAFTRAAKALKANGTFSGLADLVPYPEINNFLAADLNAREASRTGR